MTEEPRTLSTLILCSRLEEAERKVERIEEREEELREEKREAMALRARYYTELQQRMKTCDEGILVSDRVAYRIDTDSGMLVCNPVLNTWDVDDVAMAPEITDAATAERQEVVS